MEQPFSKRQPPKLDAATEATGHILEGFLLLLLLLIAFTPRSADTQAQFGFLFKLGKPGKPTPLAPHLPTCLTWPLYPLFSLDPALQPWQPANLTPSSVRSPVSPLFLSPPLQHCPHCPLSRLRALRFQLSSPLPRPSRTPNSVPGQLNGERARSRRAATRADSVMNGSGGN